VNWEEIAEQLKESLKDGDSQKVLAYALEIDEADLSHAKRAIPAIAKLIAYQKQRLVSEEEWGATRFFAKKGMS
jgi:hypothetical protein